MIKRHVCLFLGFFCLLSSLVISQDIAIQSLHWRADDRLITGWSNGTLILLESDVARPADRNSRMFRDLSGNDISQILSTADNGLVVLLTDQMRSGVWQIMRFDAGLNPLGKAFPLELSSQPKLFQGPDSQGRVFWQGGQSAWHYWQSADATDQSFSQEGMETFITNIWRSPTGDRTIGFQGTTAFYCTTAPGPFSKKLKWQFEVRQIQPWANPDTAIMTIEKADGRFSLALVRLKDGAILQELMALKTPGPVTAVSADGKRLAVLDPKDDGPLRLFSLPDGQALPQADLPSRERLYNNKAQEDINVQFLALSPTGNRLAAATSDGTIQVFSTGSGGQMGSFSIKGAQLNQSVLFGWTAYITWAAYAVLAILLGLSLFKILKGRMNTSPLIWGEHKVLFVLFLITTVVLGINAASLRGLELGFTGSALSLLLTWLIFMWAAKTGLPNKTLILRLVIMVAVAVGVEFFLRSSFMLHLKENSTISQTLRWSSGRPVVDEGDGLWFYPLVTAAWACRVGAAMLLVWLIGRKLKK